MKIRVIDRIVLFLLAVAALLAGVCAALKEFGISVLALIPEGSLPQIGQSTMFIVRIAAIVVVILLSFYLFGIAFRRKKKPEPFINMESGSKGTIRMSMDSISGLVLRTCGSIPGISGLKVTTVNHEDSVSVDMAFQVEVDRNIPELSGQIQQLVGEVVEKNCGVAVRKVCVTVSGFTAPAKAAALPEAEKPAKAQKKGLFARAKEEKPAQKIEAEFAEPAVEEIPVVPVVPVIVPEEVPAEEPMAEEAPAFAAVIEQESAVEEILPETEPETAVPEEEIVAAAIVEEYVPDESDEYIPTENE